MIKGAASSPTVSGFLHSEIQVQLLEGPPVTAHVQIHGDYPEDHAHENTTLDVPVEEDTSCPESGDLSWLTGLIGRLTPGDS